MTYVELIVVLSIFAVMTSVVLFNYGTFQATVDIKNLASDIALNIVEAQKSSLSGLLPPPSQQAQIDSTWKPSYGVYFSTADNSIIDNKSFIYFADVGNATTPQNNLFDGTSCTGECLSRVDITKGNYISDISVFYKVGSATGSITMVGYDLAVTFSRPNSSAIMKSNAGFFNGITPYITYVQITIASPQSVSATVKIYPSGRIQIN